MRLRDVGSRDPDAAQVITTDLERFWDAIDRGAPGDTATRAAAFQDVYLRPGSPGLRCWMQERLIDSITTPPARAEQAAAQQLALATALRPRFYSAIRPNALAIGGREPGMDAIRSCLHQVQVLYSDAVFPDIYFLVGRLTSAGTVGLAGLLMAAEMLCGDEQTPMDELSAWERANVGPVTGICAALVHELVHCQHAPLARDATLLERALREGAADFIAALVTGSVPGPPDRDAFGAAFESLLWQEFRQTMHTCNARGWLYQGDRAGDRPADLGYYLGRRICETYYARLDNPRVAIREILTLADPVEFLRVSGYAP